MITLKNKETKRYTWNGAEVCVTYRILTAAEAIDMTSEKLADHEIIDKFAESITSNDIKGWDNGVTGTELWNTAGTIKLVNKIASDIVSASFMDVSEKN